MKQLPEHVKPYKKTPEFTQATVPKGLLNDHQTKDGVWAQIIIVEGVLKYTISEPDLETIMLDKETRGVIEPQVLHRIAPVGDVRFFIEFSR